MREESHGSVESMGNASRKTFYGDATVLADSRLFPLRDVRTPIVNPFEPPVSKYATSLIPSPPLPLKTVSRSSYFSDVSSGTTANSLARVAEDIYVRKTRDSIEELTPRRRSVSLKEAANCLGSSENFELHRRSVSLGHIHCRTTLLASPVTHKERRRSVNFSEDVFAVTSKDWKRKLRDIQSELRKKQIKRLSHKVATSFTKRRSSELLQS
ncbi:hypothetical protein BC832DRAFT_594028 [Gaertneriomyces semiglobifer]|nr:hypothetical protein BC832DRAFT_594028 [Gaertneriomyces semiglobifer]